ncbi:MAG: OmpA family protein [Gammaproteobacteria bacterium]|nr:OmpA family protein [Gammaproteobacteria bacterium]MCP5197979.1 OmpA family protein [Gammaproteobacteria bacterium]
MSLLRLATTGLLALSLFATGFIVPGAVAQQSSDDDYVEADSGPGDDDLSGAEQEFDRIITPEYRRLGMRVEPLPDGSLRLRLPSEVMFAYDSAEISPDFVPTLREIARFLKRRRGIRARIVGHTDNKGSESYNLDLSLQRAESVAMFLGAQGIKKRRLLTQGRGEQEPIASNATPEGRQRNRRVDVVLFRRARGDRPKQN